MPVEKFRSLDAARRALDERRPTASIEARARALFALTATLSPTRFTPGVRKYRSIADADRERDVAGTSRP